MDGFMTEILSALREDGEKAVKVFPPSTHVLLSFSERLAVEVVCPDFGSVFYVVIDYSLSHLGRRVCIIVTYARTGDLE